MFLHSKEINMAKLFQFILLCILQLYFLSFNIPILNAYHLCLRDQSLALLNFKDSLQIDTYERRCLSEAGSGVGVATVRASYCYNPTIKSKIRSWNSSTDCCNWDGVTCDEFTGQVIELDLSTSRLNGVIDSNSSIFQLSHLKSLNLAYNFLDGSEISPKFCRFTHLSHLNLTNSQFQGQIPSELSQLNELVSLDLSENYELIVEPQVFEVLLQNMTSLKELYLHGVPIFSSFPKNLSLSLTIIDLSSTEIIGKFPYHIFHLPNLKKLSLGYNSFDGLVSFASVKWNTTSSLQELDLPYIFCSGKLPDTIGNLKHLTFLDLSGSELMGTIPRSFGNLTQLTYLDLSSNHFSGHIPPGIVSLERLTFLDISRNGLDAPTPYPASSKLKRLKVLYLTNNKLTSNSFSSILSNSTQLETIDLSYNPLFKIPLEFFELLFVQSINLGYTQLQGPIPKKLSNLVNLKYLDLGFNNLSGPIEPEAFSNLVSLEHLNLESNNFSGRIETKALSNLVNLKFLNLSSNNFCSSIDVMFLSNIKGMGTLDLSFSSLSLINENNTTLPMISINSLKCASCNIRDLDVLRSIVVVDQLNLPYNNIQGEIPEWVWSNWSNVTLLDLSNNFITHIGRKITLESLVVLNLGSNLLQGHLPVLSHSILKLSLPNNQFYGEINSSICKLRGLRLLELFNNNFSGALPHCFWMMINDLQVLDLHMNNLQGGIPNNFSMNALQSMNLRGNHFEGEVPRSFINCYLLEVLDLSENKLKDTFPIWLGDLPNLRVLSLRSNKLYGPISSHHISVDAFSQLQILDLSYNQLSGSLPSRLFQRFKKMMRVDETSRNYFGDQYTLNSSYLIHLGFQPYHDSITLVFNGNTMLLEKILVAMSVIDLSCNLFEGKIPNSIGGLISIQQLNLSHNKFTGQIPPQLGNLSNLHSLDLSSNHLDGNIPNQLARLGFLSVMNLSCNHLTGRIPTGPQLQTLPKDSYIGNDGLCGYPLSRNCGNDNPSMMQPRQVGVPGEEDDREFVDGFTWQSVVMGYGVGMFVGLVIGSLMLFTEKPKWLIRIVREEANKIIYKYKSRNGISLTWNRRS